MTEPAILIIGGNVQSICWVSNKTASILKDSDNANTNDNDYSAASESSFRSHNEYSKAPVPPNLIPIRFEITEP